MAIPRTTPEMIWLEKKGIFRKDLIYRLSTHTLTLPPLRERKTDILLLADYFLEGYAEENGREVKRLSTPAIDMLMAYHWPGNVRELKHTMERAVILGKGSDLSPEDLHLFDTTDRPGEDSFRLEDVEKRTILTVVEKCRGNHSKAAQMLNISRTTLYVKLKKYGI